MRRKEKSIKNKNIFKLTKVFFTAEKEFFAELD